MRENTLDDLVALKGIHSDIKSLYGFEVSELQRVIETVLNFIFEDQNLLSLDALDLEMLSSFLTDSIDYHLLGQGLSKKNPVA